MSAFLRRLFDPLNPASVRQRYDQLGFSYNKMMRHNAHLEEAFNALHREGGHRFLDVGAGAGRHLLHCRPDNAYQAIDLSSCGIFLNRRRYSLMKEPRPKVDFKVADAQLLTEKRDFFDGAIFAYSLSTMKRPSDAVRRVVDTVVSRGTIVILDYIKTHEPFTPVWLARRISAYDPSRSIEELIGESSLTFLYSQKFLSSLPEASLYVFTK